MNLRRILLLPACLVVLGWLSGPSAAYVEERYTLARTINESTNIVLVQVEKVNKQRKLIYYKKIADLKGKHPTDVIKHNVGVGGFNEREQKAPIEWAEPGKLAIFFHNGGASETCIGKYWYQAYAGGEWWNHSHGEPYMCRTYCGDIEGLRAAVLKLLKGEEVVIPAAVGKTDFRIQKVKATMKSPLDYIVVEPPSIEPTKLEGVAGFSELIELPRPAGHTQGAIAVDFDNDGYTDLLMVGTEGLVLLRNNHKGNFDDVTAKWGLAGDTGCRAAAFADYNRSGRLSLLTSEGKLYTNLGDKFKDDSDRLPKTPKRVSNPGEALAWIDFNGDGLPDIVCSVGARGLAAFQNTGGKGGVWFEDVSAQVGLGETGLGQEACNFLTALDVDNDGRPDFILNLDRPLIALNRDGVFKASADTGLSFPTLPRPAVALADFLNSGHPGLFVSAAERQGALLEWQMIGTFSAEEDKKLGAGPDFSPRTRPDVKQGDTSWAWQGVRAKATGALEIRRGQPSPNSAYAWTTFDWPAKEKIFLYFGSENSVTVWLNGKQVYERKDRKPYMADSDRVEVDVNKGANTVLVRVFDEGPLWRTCVRPSPMALYPPPAVRLYRGDGKGKFTDATLDAGDLAQLRADAVTATWADLDNDGLLDLIVTCKTGLVRYYHNLGNGKFRYATADLGLEQKFKAAGALTADFNKDGLLDLVLLGADPEPCVVLLSKVKPKLPALTLRFGGPESAVGAVVRVLDGAGKLRGTRHISGSDGRNLQATPEARFALAPGKYRVETRYSSGRVRAREVAIVDRPLWVTIDDKTALAKTP
jgi:hypothetical protein